MDESPHETMTAWWFIRAYSLRIVVACVLLAACFGVACLRVTHLRERRISRTIESLGGEVENVCLEPTWIPARLQGTLPLFDRIVSVNLDGCEVTPDLLSELGALRNLKNLHLNSTHISDAGLEKLKWSTSLVRLSFYDTDVTDAGLEHLKNLKGIEEICMGHNEITDDGLKHLGQMSKLIWVLVHDTRVSEKGASKLQESIPNVTFFGVNP